MLPKNNYRSPNAEPDYWGSMSVRDEADAPPNNSPHYSLSYQIW